MEMEDLFHARPPAHAPLAARPIWNPGLPTMEMRGRCSGAYHCLACGTGCLLAVGLWGDMMGGALIDGAHSK